jgi:hypothetical protein
MAAGYGSGNPSVLDRIVRTYRNAAGDVIATQTISVVLNYIDGVNAAGMALQTSDSQSTNRFRRTASIKLKTVRSPKSGASATVATVVTEGSFDSRSESSGDVVSVTYTGTSGQNDLIIPVNALGGVLKVGDSV